MEVAEMVRLPRRDKSQTAIHLNLSELMRDFSAEIIEPAENAGSLEIVRLGEKESGEHFVRCALRPKKPIAAGQLVQIHFSGSLCVVENVDGKSQRASRSHVFHQPLNRHEREERHREDDGCTHLQQAQR
jgi:hypothetical protein